MRYPLLTLFMNFNSYFSDTAIIKHLCSKRVSQANKVYERDYICRLAGVRTPPNNYEGVRELLPPRSQWHSFRPKYRHNLDANLQSVINATIKLRVVTPNQPWVIRLNQFIRNVQDKAKSLTYQFEEPEIYWTLKKEHTYRAISNFSLVDGVISSLLARYLTDLFDPIFGNNSYAFRSTGRPNHELSRETAINNLYAIRTTTKDLYVAECDIKGFFDCIEHNIAKQAFEAAIKRLPDDRPIDPLAVRLFHSYLACFTFPKCVSGSALTKLKEADPLAEFKWPVKDLEALWHTDPNKMEIGVPQGGAVSGFIANLVLDVADKKVEELGDRASYFRYCDDTLFLAKDSKTCEDALNRYLSVLNKLRLPYHQPVKTWFYDKAFWNGKSKSPYKWSGRKWFNSVPWAQFIGYQMRYDGLMRVREDSVKKEKAKMVETVDNVKFGLISKSKAGFKIVANRYQVVVSLYQKLATTAVGKRRLGKNSIAPKCWVHGFRELHNKPIVKTALQALDRLREHQTRRLKRANIKYGTGKLNTRSKIKNQDNEYLSSYYAQYNDVGGQELINNPYKPAWYERWFLEPVYNLAKKINGQVV